jgi:hypothetical protein
MKLLLFSNFIFGVKSPESIKKNNIFLYYNKILTLDGIKI